MCTTAKNYVVFYYFVCLARTLVGNGGSFLSTSFADKGMVAYVKVLVLCLCIAVGLHLADNLFKNKLRSLINYTVGSFAIIYLIYVCLIDLPRMGIVVILGAIALFAGVVLFTVDNYSKTNDNPADLGDVKEKYLVLGSSLLLFISIFLLNGPTELYVYNTADFVF